jgi:hypothetical protein
MKQKVRVLKSSKDHRHEIIQKKTNEAIEELAEKEYQLSETKLQGDLPLIAFLVFEKK